MNREANGAFGTEMDWKDRQEMRNGSWYTHDLRLTIQEWMNVLANHQTTHKDELADHQINKPVQTDELAKNSLSHSEKRRIENKQPKWTAFIHQMDYIFIVFCSQRQ